MKSMRKQFLSITLAFALACFLLPGSVLAAGNNAWDGKTIDVSWYNKNDTTLYISTPAQLMGLAAIVNGIYNAGITSVIGDASCIQDNCATAGSGSNNKSTTTYHYGADDFNGKTVCLKSDLDMGGVCDPSTGTWSGPNFMPIGGQYLMAENDSAAKLSASFCGTFDGQGHTIYNINCKRHCSNGNYGDGESIGLIGRLGVHDNDPKTIRPVNPTVRNVAITGYVYGNRCVGGIVGKMGKTSYNNGDGSTGGIIENCANFAAVSNTDAKGCGGICGASWNGGVIQNCYNAGKVSTTYSCPTGGIAGSNEIKLRNCYSVGTVFAPKDSYAMAIGTNNGGAPYTLAAVNCWYLDGSAPGGGYYSSGTACNDGAMTGAQMKSADFGKTLGDAFAADTNGVNNGYPILQWQKDMKSPYVSPYTDVSATAWYAGAVNYVMTKGLFDPAGTNTFGPDAPMTRAMLVTALYRLAGAPAVDTKRIFADIPENAAYWSAVNWACKNGIVTGTGAGSFSPGGTVTREQLAAMLLRYASFAKADTAAAGDTSKFSDQARISGWARQAVAWAVGEKLLNGTGDSRIDPLGTATRAQSAQILLNFSGIVSPE